MPPVAARLAVYAAPKVAPGNVPAGVVIVGLIGTLSFTVCVMVDRATDVAVRLTVKAVATVAGAV
jgi:hypothetical protein